MGEELYEIHVKGHLGPGWSDWFDRLTGTNLEGGEALLSGPMPDQAALHGLLARLHGLNLALLGVRRVVPSQRLTAQALTSSMQPVLSDVV
jgi:hypothetical protein